MPRDRRASRDRPSERLLASAFVGVCLLVQLGFLVNIALWRNAPDVGWIPLTEYGPKAIGFVSPLGTEVGLRRADRILSVNGEAYETQDELNQLLDFEVGGTTVYELERAGRTFTLSVTTGELGLRRVLMQSGVMWLLGVMFVALGALVFLMKPYHGPSWTFLLMAGFTGTFITYTSPSYFFTPAALDNVALVVPPFVAAAILHLAALFPKRRAYSARLVWIAGPYLLALALKADFALLRAHKADTFGNVVYRGTSQNFNGVMATAARTTIVEVDDIVEPSELDPGSIDTPGIYVRRIVAINA